MLDRTTKKQLNNEQLNTIATGIGLLELGYWCMDEKYDEDGAQVWRFVSPEYQTIEIRILTD